MCTKCPSDQGNRSAFYSLVNFINLGYIFTILCASASKACTSVFCFFLSPDFHELWHSVRSICLITEVKWQWATFSTWMADCLSALLVSSMAVRLVDRNPFRPCLLLILGKYKVNCKYMLPCYFIVSRSQTAVY